jgi:hypothetical protein
MSQTGWGITSTVRVRSDSPVAQASRLPWMAALAIALVCFANSAFGQGISDSNWGANYSKCEGARSAAHYKAESTDDDRIEVNGIISCVDDGDSFVYTVEYMNFALAPNSKWSSVHFEWLGAGAQRKGEDDQNDWIYDEVRPIKVEVKSHTKHISISDISFRVPKSVLAKARGFNFYVVGGGIFWTVKLTERLDQTEYNSPPFSNTPAPTTPADKAPSKTNKEPPPGALPLKAEVVPSQRPDWGQNFPTCSGARSPVPFKAAILENYDIQGSGVVTCRDDGDALIYSIDYMNFTLAPTSKWPSAHLEWYGAGAQRGQVNAQNDWIYDEAIPIKVDLSTKGKRVSITDISFRVPKTVLAQARGFGFYVVGGGILWSILLL